MMRSKIAISIKNHRNQAKLHSLLSAMLKLAKLFESAICGLSLAAKLN